MAVGGWSLAAAPCLAPFPEAVASEGARYAGFFLLDDWVTDNQFADEDLIWSVDGQGELVVRITAARHLVIQPPREDWFGTAELTLTVCNPSGECASGVLSVRVENTPDDPVIERIPGHVAPLATPFRPLDLGLFGWDPDGPENLVWSATAPEPLRASIHGSLLTVTRPLPSAGSWAVDVRLEDSDGRSTTRTLTFTAAEDPTTVTFLGNAGFVLESGADKVLIDSLVNEGLDLTPGERQRLRGARYPFDGVDAALATHAHYDHFDADTVAAFLTSSPECTFVSLDESIDALRSSPLHDDIWDRLLGIPFRVGARSEHNVGGIRITAYSAPHGGGVGNLAYLIEIGGMKVLHLGDASGDVSADSLARQFGWPALGIDVALVPYWWLFDTAQADRVTAAIRPRFVIPMHYAPGTCPTLAGIESQAVAVNLCREFETWIVPPRPSAP